MAEEASESAGADVTTLVYSIGRLDRAVRQHLNTMLAPLGLSIAQFTTLSVLRRRSGLSNAQLARRALILPQSMIQVLLELERRGLVERHPDPAHQRVLRTSLTDAGQQLLDEAESATGALEAQLINTVGEADARLVAHVIGRWIEDLA